MRCAGSTYQFARAMATCSGACDGGVAWLGVFCKRPGKKKSSGEKDFDAWMPLQPVLTRSARTARTRSKTERQHCAFIIMQAKNTIRCAKLLGMQHFS